MRQWMVDVKLMCRQHLLGEHSEHHMIVGSFNKQKSIKGFIDKNCIEPLSLRDRHKELSEEMERRGYNHNSPLPYHDVEYLEDNIKNYKIDRQKSFDDLMRRCMRCLCNWLEISYIGGK